MKPSKTIRRLSGADRTVAWWSTLLLVGLGLVFMALFLTARLLLSLANEPGTGQTSVPATSLSLVASMLPARDDRTVRSHARSMP